VLKNQPKTPRKLLPHRLQTMLNQLLISQRTEEKEVERGKSTFFFIFVFFVADIASHKSQVFINTTAFENRKKIKLNLKKFRNGMLEVRKKKKDE